MQLSRRSILGAGIAGTATALLGVTRGEAFAAARRKPKNIIFCVADGMATQTLAMADQFQRIRDGRQSYWTTLWNRDDVHRGWQDTRSLNSLVTDSAAASSTWGSGRHIWNGQLNMFPDGTELRTLVNLMTEAGVRCGLVTTTTITHATPAGFAVNCVQRDLEPLIAEKYLTSGVEVLMGGGDRSFSAESRKDKRDLYGDFEKAGFKVVKSRDQLLGLKSKKILGIFSPSHLPYSVDRDNDPELAKKVPTLAEMATTAIENLKGSKKGFLLQIEGGKVDHGAHANDLAAMVYDQFAFEEAVKVAIEFAEKDGETLVIITSDHACGGPSLNGAGAEYIDSTAGLATLSNMKSSYAPIMEALGKSPSISLIQDVIETKLGLKLSGSEAQGVMDAMAGKSPFALADFHKSSGGTLAMILGNHTKVCWTSGNHTSEHVVVTAFGPGKEAIAGLNPNVKFFDIMLATKGLKWSNPTMDFATAKGHYAKLRASLDPDWLELYASHDDCGCHGHE